MLPGLTWAYSCVSSQLHCSQRKADVGWPELVWPVSLFHVVPHPPAGPRFVLMLKAQIPRGEQKQDHLYGPGWNGGEAGARIQGVEPPGRKTPSLKPFCPAGSCTMGLWREG